ncbi:MAG: hypothetical protein JW993_11005 [Sedimentisphaerales bacterium]|nr:hypothetical protein [Sedimentisphaerales bacterium]
MNRLVLTVPLLALLGTGCTPVHRVYVNGYSELDEPVDKGAPIYVGTDPNSQNPIFERQVKAKLQRLLEQQEYTLANAPQDAAYELDFQVGMRSEGTLDYVPAPGMYGGYHRRPWGGFAFGYDTYVPYLDRQYDQWLVLRLFRRHSDAAVRRQLVWVGDAMMSTETAALREAVNYLLVAVLDVFGIDTAEQLSVTIRKDDPRLAEVATSP